MSFHDRKHVIVRKDRICNGCIAPCVKGTRMLYMVGKKSYDFYSSHICNTCEQFLLTHPNYFNDDWWNEGDIGTAIEEERWVPSGNS